jgi:hypothetical protein
MIMIARLCARYATEHPQRLTGARTEQGNCLQIPINVRDAHQLSNVKKYTNNIRFMKTILKKIWSDLLKAIGWKRGWK